MRIQFDKYTGRPFTGRDIDRHVARLMEEWDVGDSDDHLFELPGNPELDRISMVRYLLESRSAKSYFASKNNRYSRDVSSWSIPAVSRHELYQD